MAQTGGTAYLDPSLHAAMLFRLLFNTQTDRYEPEVACYVLGAVAALDHETIAATWACEAYMAEQGLERERN